MCNGTIGWGITTDWHVSMYGSPYCYTAYMATYPILTQLVLEHKLSTNKNTSARQVMMKSFSISNLIMQVHVSIF